MKCFKLARIVGQKVVVDYRLIKDLQVRFTREDGDVTVDIEGEIMESAKNFKAVHISAHESSIYITVYASLVFWKKNGSPVFSASHRLRLPPGLYSVFYLGDRRKTTFLKKVRV